MPAHHLEAASSAVDENVSRRAAFAVDLARRLGEMSLDPFCARTFAAMQKADGTVVTEVDRRIEQAARELTGREFPEDSFLGEEYPEKRGPSPFRWIVDPIDGTISFVQGVPLYGTLIAVERAMETVIGVVLMPVLDELVFAVKGGGAWHQLGESERRRASVSDRASLPESLVCMTAFDSFAMAGQGRTLDALFRRCGCVRGWSDCYAHVLVATGRADAVIEPSIKPWDVAPMTVIMEEAGGRYTDWDGRKTAHSPTGLASNGQIHDELLGALREAATGEETQVHP